MKEMLARQTAVRGIALLLLLFAAVDLFGVDLFSPGLCGSPISDAPGAGPADEDDCFCCCGHIVFATPPTAMTAGWRLSDSPPLTVVAASADLKAVYHPPRF